MLSPDSSITGGTEAAFTTPTYTLTSDSAPEALSRLWIVSALGGTQTDVRSHSGGDPFRLLVRRFPYRVLPPKNPNNGAYGSVPNNKAEIIVTKGLKIDSAGTIRNGEVRITVSLPAGCEVNDPKNVRALGCFSLGLWTEEAQDFNDSMILSTW